MKMFFNALNLSISIVTGLMFLVVLFGVIMRYGLGTLISVSWVEELSTLMLAWLTYFSIIILQKEGKHLKVDLFRNRLSTKVLPLYDAFVDHLPWALFLAFVVRWVIPEIIDKWTWESTSLQWSQAIWPLGLLIGCGMAAIFCISQVVQAIWKYLEDTK